MRRREKRGAFLTPRALKPPRRRTKRRTASSPTGSSRSPRVARSSARPELAISRIAEAGHDVALLVQALVERRDMDRNVGVRARESAHSLRRGDEADVLHALRAPFLENVDRRHG